MRKKKKGEIVYQLTRRTPISSIGSLSLSTLSDNYVVVHCPSEYDNLFENDKKTEIVAVLSELAKNNGRELTLNFSDSISYKIKTKDSRNVNFSKNEGAAQATVKKSGKNLNVQVKSGLPKDTDTTPKNFTRGANRQRPAGPSGGGGAAMGGGGAAMGGAMGGGGAAMGGGGGVRQSVNRGGMGGRGGRGG